MPSPCRVIALSGPSGTGKTTLTELLHSSLAAEGLRVAVVHQDTFFHGPKPASYWTQEPKESPDTVDMAAVRAAVSAAVQVAREHGQVVDPEAPGQKTGDDDVHGQHVEVGVAVSGRGYSDGIHGFRRSAEDQAVADAVDRDQDLGLGRVGLELLADAGHVVVDGAGRGVAPLPPHVVEDLVA